MNLIQHTLFTPSPAFLSAYKTPLILAPHNVNVNYSNKINSGSRRGTASCGCLRSSGTSGPVGLAGRFVDDERAEEVDGLPEALVRRHQTVLMLDREYTVVADETKGRDEGLPPLGAMAVADGAEDPASGRFVGVGLGVENTVHCRVARVDGAVLGVDVVDAAFERLERLERIDALPEEMRWVEVGADVVAGDAP